MLQDNIRVLGLELLNLKAQGANINDVNKRLAMAMKTLGEERLGIGKKHLRKGIASLIGAAFLFSELGNNSEKRYCARTAYVATRDSGIEKFIWEVFLA